MRRTLILVLLGNLLLSACGPAATPMPMPGATSAATPTPVPTPTPGATATPTLPPPSTPGVASLAGSSASDLVDQITRENASLEEAFQATQEVLARGGIAIGDLQNTFVRPYAPASSLVLTPREVLQLAEEARSGPSVWRLDLAEFGQFQGDVGWPSEGGSTPGEQLATLIFTWGAEAAKNPEEPENFAPLFLLAMAQHRAPEIDFAAGAVSPEQIRFGTLELVLLVAAFDRAIPSKNAAHLHSMRLGTLFPAANPSARVQISPCNPYLGPLFGRLTDSRVVEFLLQYATGKALEKALEAAGISEWDREKISKAMFGLGMAMRVIRAVLLTTYVRIGVSVEGDNPVHKPLEGERLLKAFHARAGISPQDWRAYQEQIGKGFHDALRECLSWLGISIPSLDDIVSEMGTWSIEWRLTAGSPEHARWSPDHQIVPGQAHQVLWRTGLALPSAGSTVGESTFVVEIRNEKESDHPGLLLEAPVTACAYLDVAQSPSFSTFAQAAAGGLAGAAESVVELMTAMMQRIAKPKACQDLQVIYHTNCIAALADVQSGLRVDAETLDSLRKCLTFELRFESQVQTAGSQGGSYRSAVESTVKLQLDPADFTIKGQAPLVNTAVELDVDVPGCTSSATPGGGTFQAFKLEFIFQRRIQTDEIYVRDLKLVYDPGKTSETTTVTCPDTGSQTIPGPFWLAGYVVAHESEISEPDGGFVAAEWEIPGGEVYAEKEWNRSVELVDGVTTESGRFILYHRPE